MSIGTVTSDEGVKEKPDQLRGMAIVNDVAKVKYMSLR